jgi:uncharacterized membrane protein YphA (DoxX/SURF4 family)
MKNMQDSMAYPGEFAAPALPAWKTVVSTLAAIVVAALFLSAGIWKIVDPIDWATRVYQLKVPGSLAQPFTILLGVTETLGGVLLLVPRFRRWGAWLTALMLVAFMAWVGLYYGELTGKDCSCFPWLKRAIGPGFFAGDAVMLGGSLLAGLWAQRSRSWRGAAVVLAVISVFAGVSYGVAVTRESGVRVPERLTVDGKSTEIDPGKYFLYFFDPECSHCLQAAREMAPWDWSRNGVRVLQIPTRVPQFAASFQSMSGFKSPIAQDFDTLKAIFPFGDPPYGVLVEGRRAVATVPIFDGREPAATLKKHGFLSE